MYEGHLNVALRDHDSIVTHNGRHDRVVCFLPSGGELYMRVDNKWGLGFPTVPEMLDVARKDQGVSGRWEFARAVEHSDGKATDVFFKEVL